MKCPIQASLGSKAHGPSGIAGSRVPHAALAWVCHSAGVHGRLTNSLSPILECQVCSLLANKVQRYSSAGNVESIYKMLLEITPSGDVPEEYGFGQQLQL